MRINPFSCAQLVSLHIGFLGWSQSKHLDLIKFRLFFFGMVSRVHVCKCFVADFVSPIRNCSHAQVGDTKPNEHSNFSEEIKFENEKVEYMTNQGSRLIIQFYPAGFIGDLREDKLNKLLKLLSL